MNDQRVSQRAAQLLASLQQQQQQQQQHVGGRVPLHRHLQVPQQTSTFVSPGKFHRDCQRQLLSHQVVVDGTLSQVDYATFINNYCIAKGACDPKNPPLEFVNLNVEIQLSFVWSLCPNTPDITVQDSCLQTLQNSGPEFGYVVTPATFTQVAKDVSELCKTLYPLLKENGLLPSTSTEPTTSAPTTNTVATASPSFAATGATPAPSTPVLTPVPSTATTTNAPSPAPVAVTTAPTTTAPSTGTTTTAPSAITTTTAPSAVTTTTAPSTVTTTTAPSTVTTTTAPSTVTTTTAPSTVTTTAPSTVTTTAPSSSTGAPSTSTTNAPTSPSTNPPTPVIATSAPTVTPLTTIAPSSVTTSTPSAATATAAPSYLSPAPPPSLRAPSSAPSSRGGVNGIGGNGPAPGGSVSSSRSTGLSSGGIVGVAAAGLAVLLLAFLFTRRRRKTLQQSDKVLPDYLVPIEGDESIYTEGTPAYAVSKKGSGRTSGSSDRVIMEDQDAMIDTGSIKDGSSDAQSSSSSDMLYAGPDLGAVAASSKHVAQYDSVSAAGIALLLKDGNDQSSCASKSSGPARTGGSGSPSPQFLEELETAIDEADWQLVWKLATSVSQKDDLSTISGATGNAPAIMGRISRAGSFSSSSARKPRPYLDPADEARASQLDELVEKRDWTAVAVTAALFLRQNDPSANLVPLHPRRSFIDFVTGRRVSTAAAAAAAGDSESSSQQSSTGRVGAVPIAGPVPLIVAAKTDTNSTGSGDYAKKSSKGMPSPSRTAATVEGTPAKTASTPGLNPASPGSDEPSPSSPVAQASAHGASAEVVGAVMRQPSLSQSKKGRIFGFFRRNPSGHVPLESSSSEDTEAATPKVFKDDSSPSRSGHDGNPDFANQRSGSFSSSMGGSSLASMRTELDRAVLRGDWAAVEAISAQVEAMDEFIAHRGNISKTNSSDDENIPGTPTIHRKHVAFAKASPSVDSTFSRDEYSASAETSGNTSVSSIRTKLDRAVASGDWQAVDYFASLLMELEGAGHGAVIGGGGGGGSYEGHMELDYSAPDSSTSSPLISSVQPRFVTPTASSVSSGSLGRSADYTAHLHQRLEVMDKLVKAEKWKGVRVMAGLYEIDEQGPSPGRLSFPFTSTYTPQPLTYPNTDMDALAEVWRAINPETVTPSTVVGDSSVVDIDSLSSGSDGRGVTPTPDVSKPAAYTPLDLDSQQVKDWKGLAGVRDEEDVSRKLFETETYMKRLAGGKGGQVTSLLTGDVATTEGDRVRLRQGTALESDEAGSDAAAAKGVNVELRRITPPSKPEASDRQDRKSLHGAKVLIPFWEELVAQAPQSEDPRTEGNLSDTAQIQRGTKQGGES